MSTVKKVWHAGRACITFRRAVNGSVYGRVVVRGRVDVGARVRITGVFATTELVAEPGAHLSIGDRTFINGGVSICACESVMIGQDCLIGPGVLIADTNFHQVDPVNRRTPRPPRPVVIGDNVWLCSRCMVLPGVTIGRDAVVGAGAIVKADVPAGVVVEAGTVWK